MSAAERNLIVYFTVGDSVVAQEVFVSCYVFGVIGT